MRITHNLMTDRLLNNLWSTQRRLVRLHNQGSSGKRVNVPSDDPAGTMTILRYRSGLEELDRHAANAAEAVEWMTISDDAIMHVHENLHRVREIAILGSNSSLPDDARLAYVAELNEIIDQIVTLGNTTYDGRYVFAGHETLAPAFEVTRDTDGFITAVAYQGDDGVVEREVDQSTTLRINLIGGELLGFGALPLDPGDPVAGQGVFRLLLELREAIGDGDVEAVSGVLLGELAQVHEEVNKLQVKLGATVRRADQAQNQIRDMRVTMESLLSNVEDADVAEVTMRLSTAEASYRYALAVGARIIQPSLIEYLR